MIVQPAPAVEIAPIVALAYGLSERERDVARLCLQGRSTKEMAAALIVSPYTVQDRRAHPRRAGRSGVPRALRAALGAAGRLRGALGDP